MTNLKRYIIFLLVLCSAIANAQSPTLIASGTYKANGIGASGIPTVTIDIPAGKNRLMIISTFSERIHASYNSNFVYNADGKTDGEYSLDISVNGISAQWISGPWTDDTDTPSKSTTIFTTQNTVRYISDAMGMPSGLATITFPGINLPENSGDEMIVQIAIFENANPNPTFHDWKNERNFDTATDFLTLSGTTPTIPVGNSINDLVFFGTGGISQPKNVVFSNGWTTIQTDVMNNTNGTSSYQSSLSPNEHDGIGYTTAYRTISSGNPSFTLSRSATNNPSTESASANLISILPMAKPSVSGTVYIDNNGMTGGIDNGGTGGGTWNIANALYVNAVDTNGNVVATALVNTSGVFTFPSGGKLIEGDVIKFQLSKTQGTVGQPAPTKELPAGWAIVGESTTGGSSDGTPNGEFTLTIGTANSPNSTTNRFGVVTSAPFVRTTITNTCPAITVNLNTAHTGTIPAGSSLVWYTNSNHTGSALSVTQITQAGAGTYYAFYYDSVAKRYSPASNAVTVLINTTDLDGDGVFDACDLDNDNDGILDTDEGFCLSTPLLIESKRFSATGSGTTGRPNITFSAPTTGTGKRLMFLTLTIERDHTYTPYGDNWESTLPATDNFANAPVVKFGSNNMYPSSYNTSFKTSPRTSISHSDATISVTQYVYRLWDSQISAGSNSIDLSNFQLPKNDGDEWHAEILVFDNVYNLDYIGTQASSDTTNSLSISGNMLSSSQPAGTIEKNNVLLAFGATSAQSGMSINSGWNAITTNSVANTKGTYATDPNKESDLPENDGISVFTATKTGVTGNQTATFSFNKSMSTALMYRLIPPPCNLRDTDGDGIPDYLDLDSDGDGCPDAIEGGANITASQLTSASGTLTSQSPNQNFGTTVDANGVPKVVGASGQAIGQSQDASKNDCIDSDGDGYPNWQDLDDDNDGILDTDECVLTNLVTNGNFDTDFTSAWMNDGGWTYNAAGKYVENKSTVYGGSFGNFTQLISNLPPTTIPLTFTLGAKDDGANATGSLEVFLGGTLYATVNNSTATTNNITLTLSNGATSNFTPFTATSTYATQTFTINIPYTGPKSAALNFKMGANQSDDWYLDNISINTCDTDADGIPNDLDLDSDNDGCPDAIEGGGNFTASQLTTAFGTIAAQTPNQNFGVDVDANGVPNIVGTAGQTVGQSLDATKNDCLDSDNDGYPNWLDLDDDNDGILDTDECPNTAIISNGTFTSPVTEWTLGTGWDVSTGIAINDDDNVNSNLSQTLNNLNQTNGTVKLSFTLGAQDAFNSGNNTASLSIILNGTTYATFDNGSARAIGTNNVTQTLFSGATSTFTPFSTAISPGFTTQNITITIPYTGPDSAVLTFNHSAGGDDWSIDNVSIDTSICDLDGDGISNELDLDSDGDGCPDALEGAGNFTASQLTNASGAIASQTPNQNFGTSVDANGIPTTVGASGQGFGNSQNAMINDCIVTECPPDPYAAQQTWWLSNQGDKVRIDFDFQTGSPVLNNPPAGFLGQGNTGDGQEGNTTVTHPVTGELLFVTDGSNVYRGSDGAQATGFAGGSTTSAEAAAVIPDPQGILGRDFIIFGNGATSSFGAITRAKYNLETNTIHSKVTYLAGSTTEALEVIPHTNGTDYWVLVTTADERTKSFLYSKTSGFNTTPVSSIDVPYAANMATNSFISWDPRIPGKVLIARQNKVGLANFNPSTGVLGTWQVYITVNNPNPNPVMDWTTWVTGYGAALSPNGRYIYYQEHDQPNNRMYLKYYDLINNTTTTLDYTIGLTAATKIAPDGKLYRIGYVGSLQQLFYIDADADTPPATAGSQVQFGTGGRQVSSQLPNNTYWACITCQSGSDAPVLTNPTITVLPSTVDDLINLLTASNKPAGTVFSIHSDAIATDANMLSSSTPLVAGTTYYISFYDGLAVCYSPTISIKIGETFCYKPAATDAGNTYPSLQGITSLNRSGSQYFSWLQTSQSAWTVLEAKTKGFVLNRVRFNSSNQPVATDGITLVITNPIEGMIVYDISNNCLKLYTSVDNGVTFNWYCLTTQTCPN